jgi:hypothetical protein
VFFRVLADPNTEEDGAPEKIREKQRVKASERTHGMEAKRGMRIIGSTPIKAPLAAWHLR